MNLCIMDYFDALALVFNCSKGHSDTSGAYFGGWYRMETYIGRGFFISVQAMMMAIYPDRGAKDHSTWRTVNDSNGFI